MYNEFLKSIESTEIVYATDFIEEFPSFYRYVKKAELVKLHKGIYAKDIKKKNILTNKYVSYTKINKTNICINEYKNHIVPTNLTLTNKLHFTTQVSMIDEFILVDKIKMKNIDKKIKLYYNNTQLNTYKELYYYTVLKSLFVDYELDKKEVVKFLKNNKKEYDKYLQTYLNLNKSNKITYTLAYIYRYIFNEEIVSIKIESLINKSSKFKLPKVLEELYV